MATTTNQGWTLPTVGGSSGTWGGSLNTNWTALDTLVGAVTAAEVAKLDGLTSSTAELNILTGVTATATEINILAGVTATATEINYSDGVTSAIQTQIAGKEDADADILKSDTTGTLTAGFDSDAEDLGTVTSGTVTLEVDATGKENFKTAVNGGAFTLAPPSTSSSCAIVVQLTNNASAGAITTSGFTVADGDSLTTTDGDDFFLTVVKVGAFSSLTVKALQ